MDEAKLNDIELALENVEKVDNPEKVLNDVLVGSLNEFINHAFEKEGFLGVVGVCERLAAAAKEHTFEAGPAVERRLELYSNLLAYWIRSESVEQYGR